MSNFNRTYVFPFKFQIPAYVKEYLQNRSIINCWIKFVKRNLYIIFKKQGDLEIQNISEAHNKILWINLSATSLGDSLMDLSSRILLKGKRLDLYTDKKNAALFNNDSIFLNIYNQETKLKSSDYDLVIVDSYSTRSMNVKARIAPFVNYVGMYGYFNGPEVNRVLFSFHRMNHLLNYTYKENVINNLAKCSISISKIDNNLIKNLKLPDVYISIAIGGEWSYRVYKKWDLLIRLLLEAQNDLNIVLIGSDNASNEAEELMKNFVQFNLFNCVAKFTFNQTAQIINKSDLLISCDGGLMHAANAVNTKIIPLFAKLTPEMQLTNSVSAFFLYDLEDVNNIPVTDVLKQYYNAINLDYKHPQVE
jgi:ADP-heptose:LPS heptosyltransferase